MRIEVTEHQLIERECGCGHRTKGRAPEGAEAPACYGPRVAATIIYLYIGQFLSKKRTAQALAELFGVPLSSGTVAAITGRAAGRLDGFPDRVRERIAASEVAGFDETGFRVDGRLAWVHCARTGKYTLLMAHPKRGKQAIEAMGVLPSFTGIAVHDAWAPYHGYVGADHQLCCAHALRELQAVADAAPEGQWCWATQAAEGDHGDARACAQGDQPGTGRRGPGRAGHPGPPVPFCGPGRGQPDRRPLRGADEEAQRAGPPPARPPRRLPPIHEGAPRAAR
jgi:transposase